MISPNLSRTLSAHVFSEVFSAVAALGGIGRVPQVPRLGPGKAGTTNPPPACCRKLPSLGAESKGKLSRDQLPTVHASQPRQKSSFLRQSGPNPASAGSFSSRNGRKIRRTAPRLNAKKSSNRSGIFSYGFSTPAASKHADFAGETVTPFLTHPVSTDYKSPLHRITAPVNL